MNIDDFINSLILPRAPTDLPSYINEKDALVTAIQQFEPDVGLYLIQKGINLNIRDEWGCTALMAAAENGASDLVELLIDEGADIDIKDNDGNSALDYAEFHEHAETSELLISRGAQTRNGKSPLEEGWDSYYDSLPIKRPIKRRVGRLL